MRRTGLILLLMILSSAFCAEAKSTMELLINKEWYEIDIKQFQIHENYYIKYTGTQRMTVGSDEEGNTKMRVQYYYLSNEKEEIFDDRKVGKNRNGKYLILQGPKHREYTEALCMELFQLDDMNMRIGDSRQGEAHQHCYVISPDQAGLEKEKEEGTVVSTEKLLVGKMWYEVDIKTGKRKRTEVKYEDDGMALFCTMADNYKEEFPDWQMREFYFSDNIEKEFDHSKIGDRENGIYLVVKEKGENGKWYAANYDITTLSANRLVLECVYPQGIPTRIFMTRNAIETSHRTSQKPQQWQLTENTWHRLDSIGVNRITFTERFDNVNVTRRYPVIKDGIRDTIVISNPYYMSNTADSEFNFDKVGRAAEGDYVVVNERTTDGGRMAVSYKVDYLNSKNMILSTVLGSIENVVAYERDLSEFEEEQILADRQDSIKGKTTLDRLSGRQWRFAKKPDSRMSKWHRWYFTDSLWAEVDFIYDEFKRVWNTRINVRSYYLSDYAHHNFNMQQLDKKYEGGKFINFYQDTKRWIYVPCPIVIMHNGNPPRIMPRRRLYIKESDRKSYSHEIRYLTDWMLVYTPTTSVRAESFTLVSD